MGEALMIPAGAWVLVADGRKALILQNEGSSRVTDLQTRKVLEAPDNPATSAQGTDAPPRVLSGTHRSAIEQTDWHQLAEDKFASDVVDSLGALHDAEPVKHLIIVAAPRTLAALRKCLPSKLRSLVTAEVDKDLTKHTVHDIQRLLG
ncbi:MAG: host attachment protein [Beijerinckiaceae bacterium]